MLYALLPKGVASAAPPAAARRQRAALTIARGTDADDETAIQSTRAPSGHREHRAGELAA